MKEGGREGRREGERSRWKTEVGDDLEESGRQEDWIETEI